MKRTYIKPNIKVISLGDDLLDSWNPIGSNPYDGELAKKHTKIIIDDEEDDEDIVTHESDSSKSMHGQLFR